MSRFLLIATLFITTNYSFSQKTQEATLTTTGSAQTKDRAVQNSLRSAIEQAFGAFISSNTEILNDELISDEITSVSSGNIEKYEILSAVNNKKDNSWFVTTKVTVSVGKLTQFVQSKGIKVEIKGGMFAANMRQQQLNKESEYKALLNMLKPFHQAMINAYDYKLEVSQPTALDQNNAKWKVKLNAIAEPNENIVTGWQILDNTLKSIALSDNEIAEYIDLKKDIFPIILSPKPAPNKPSAAELFEQYEGKDTIFPKGTTLQGIANYLNQYTPKTITYEDVFDALKKQYSYSAPRVKGRGIKSRTRVQLNKNNFSKIMNPRYNPNEIRFYILRNERSYELISFFVIPLIKEYYGETYNIQSSIHNYYSIPTLKISSNKNEIQPSGLFLRLDKGNGEINEFSKRSERMANALGKVLGKQTTGSRFYSTPIYNERDHFFEAFPNVTLPRVRPIQPLNLKASNIEAPKIRVLNEQQQSQFDLQYKLYVLFKNRNYYRSNINFKTKVVGLHTDILTFDELQSLNEYKISQSKNTFKIKKKGISINTGKQRITVPFMYKHNSGKISCQISKDSLEKWTPASFTEMCQIRTQLPFYNFVRNNGAYRVYGKDRVLTALATRYTVNRDIQFFKTSTKWGAITTESKIKKINYRLSPNDFVIYPMMIGRRKMIKKGIPTSKFLRMPYENFYKSPPFCILRGDN